MQTSFESAGRNLPREGLIILRVVVTATPLMFWAFHVLSYLSLLVIYLAFAYEPVAPVSIAVTAIWFIAFAGRLNGMADHVSARLLPSFPQSFAWAAGYLLLFLAVLPALPIALISIDLFFVSLAALGLVLSIVFFMSGNKRQLWRLGMLQLVFVPAALAFNMAFDNINSEAFKTFNGSHRAIVLMSPLAFAALFFVLWYRGLGQNRFLSERGNLLYRLMKIVDFRATGNSVNRSARTGYLLSPKFLAVHSFRQKPAWWWLRFGLTDPGRLRTGVFSTLLIFGFLSWMTLTVAQKDGIIEIFVLMFFTMQPLDDLSPNYRNWIRRLYLQFPDGCRENFMEQLARLRYVVLVRWTLILGICVLPIQWFNQRDTWLPLMLTGITLYLLSMSLSTWMLRFGRINQNWYVVMGGLLWFAGVTWYIQILRGNIVFLIMLLPLILLAFFLSRYILLALARSDLEL